jgi:hypothetical protein
MGISGSWLLRSRRALPCESEATNSLPLVQISTSPRESRWIKHPPSFSRWILRPWGGHSSDFCLRQRCTAVLAVIRFHELLGRNFPLMMYFVVCQFLVAFPAQNLPFQHKPLSHGFLSFVSLTVPTVCPRFPLPHGTDVLWAEGRRELSSTSRSRRAARAQRR